MVATATRKWRAHSDLGSWTHGTCSVAISATEVASALALAPRPRGMPGDAAQRAWAQGGAPWAPNSWLGSGWADALNKALDVDLFAVDVDKSF